MYKLNNRILAQYSNLPLKVCVVGCGVGGKGGGLELHRALRPSAVGA